MSQIAVFPKAPKVPISRTPVPEKREIDVRVGDKARVRVHNCSRFYGQTWVMR